MNGSPDFSETSQAHAELIEAVAREVIAGAAGVPGGNPNPGGERHLHRWFRF